MPFQIRQQACTDSEGNDGGWVVFDTDKRRAVSCHATQDGARASATIRINEAPEIDDAEKARLRQRLIESVYPTRNVRKLRLTRPEPATRHPLGR